MIEVGPYWLNTMLHPGDATCDAPSVPELASPACAEPSVNVIGPRGDTEDVFTRRVLCETHTGALLAALGG